MEKEEYTTGFNGVINTKFRCRECGHLMVLDDIDYDFKGKYDNYWNCIKCRTSCIEEVRFSKRFRELWHSENNDNVKDEIIKHKIF